MMVRGHSSARGLVALSCAFAVFAACSVKEDREKCPCILIVSSPEDALMRLCSDDGTFSFEGQVRGGVNRRVEVPRKKLSYSFFNLCDALFDEHGIYIPPGSESPPVRQMCGTVVAAGESVTLPVTLRKSHCFLTLDVHSLADPSAPGIPQVCVGGGVCGWYSSGDLRRGPFSVRMEPREGLCTVCLPRQADNSLTLTVSVAGVARTFALGELLASDGYDWMAPDLEDLSVYIDYAATVLDISILRFSESVDEDIVVF